MNQAFPSLIALILMTFTLKSTPLPPPAAILQRSQSEGGLQHDLAHNCASLYNDWLGAGNDRLAALQEFRLFWGCDVCCCRMLLLLLFWPCWALMPTAYLSTLVMMMPAEAHFWGLWGSGVSAWEGDMTKCKGQTARRRGVGEEWQRGEKS